MADDFLFLIPARGGSQGIAGKNLRRVGGISLVGRAVRLAQAAAYQLGGDSAIVCSTDAADIAAEARLWGALTPFLRPVELATATASSVDVALHALDQFADRRFAGVVLLQPTSPLAVVEDLLAAIDAFRTLGTAVVSVAPSHHAPWQRQPDGRLAELVDGARAGRRRQDEGERVALNGAIYIITPDRLRSGRSFLPAEAGSVLMPPERSVDVDVEADLVCCEALLNARPVAPLVVAGRTLALGLPCFVIAEAGVNHNGDVKLAHALIDAAAGAGADAVKFQTFEPETLATDDAPCAEYQETSQGKGASQREMLRRLVLSRGDHGALKRHAEDLGLVFLSSPFDEASADFLAELGVAAFKLPSGELTNHRFLAHVAGLGRPLLVSTGMARMVEVAQAVDHLRTRGASELALLHCVSSYPAPPAEANLRAIVTLRQAFGVPTGWSDHTLGIDVAVAAVAAGACVLEKHLTLDCAMAGPDHKASLEPEPFGRMVAGIRGVESALGDGIKEPRPIELPIAAVARKSLVWTRDLAAGATVGDDALVALRPGTGVSPARWTAVSGRRLARAVTAGVQVQLTDLEDA